MRPHNALNGTELAELLVSKLGRLLAKDERFKTHLCYPLVEGLVRVELRLSPGEPQTIETEVSIQEGDPLLREPEPVKIDLEVPLKVGQDQETAPDRARQESGQPVPTPTKLASGQTVDKMVSKGAKKAPEEPKKAEKESK